VAALVAAQLGLGLWTVLSVTRPSVATAHVVTGALILGCVVFVTLRSYREERA
jgi:heme A synthase